MTMAAFQTSGRLTISSDYRDIPLHLESILVENGTVPVRTAPRRAGRYPRIAAAIGAAVNEAAGVSIRELPLTPERIWRAIRDKAVAEPSSALPEPAGSR
jgi:hypothetical protein